MRRAEGSYRPSSNGAQLDLWRGENCEHKKPSPYKKLFWYGSLVWDVDAATKEKCYFGHGDHFFFSSNDALTEALCLGFAHKPGHAYGVLASIGEANSVEIVLVEAFRGLTGEPREPETARATEVLLKHLAPVTEKQRTCLSCVSAVSFSRILPFFSGRPWFRTNSEEPEVFPSAGSQR